MRFLLDTNVLIPLEDSQLPLKESLANFVRLSHQNNHLLVYHQASEDDIQRDNNLIRRQQTLSRLRQYTRLNDRPYCPWNEGITNPNDLADNEILYALYCEAVHALVTEDHEIHRKAKEKDLAHRVYYIQTADDWLKRLYERTSVSLPNIEEVDLYSLVPILDCSFFDSLRVGYPTFDNWFREKARNGLKSWVVWESTKSLGAICIYDTQSNEKITEEGMVLPGPALKLSTFKVGENMRGKKIGELFLKAAFKYATFNKLENIFIHGEINKHAFLFDLLEDFGFEVAGSHPGSGGRDLVYVKRHPHSAPLFNDISPFNYMKKFFPHFQRGKHINHYIIPIRPEFHRILFTDYLSEFDKQLMLFQQTNTAGNAIKLAYLCHAQTKQIVAGDLVMFYRSEDEKSITSLGVVEEYQSLKDPMVIAQLVSRRTVYSMSQITALAQKETRVMLFRLLAHFDKPMSLEWLKQNSIVKGNIQSITSIDYEAFERVVEHAGL
jgi:hypothetical protein